MRDDAGSGQVSELSAAAVAVANANAARDLAFIERDKAYEHCDYWRKRAEYLEAILTRTRTSLAEQFNDPADE